MGLPVLGICYGQMAMAEALGGKIVSCDHQEFDRTLVDIISDCELFHGVWDAGSKEQVWMSHGDRIEIPPPGFRTVATSDGAPFATIADDERHFYGLMYHPEVVHTPKGAKLLENFNHRVCSCVGDWTMASFREQEIDKVRAQVGDSMVICGLSGGVDLSVVAVLLHEAIGDQLQCVFVYTGFMRKVEVDLETKRKLIGATFIDVFEEEANNIGGADFLAQGTLYPDVIESISFTRGHSVTIKSHHNVGGLPERMNMDLVEPLRELFKDEVRELGRELGLPENFVGRHPFPGPGLAIRLPGGVTRKNLKSCGMQTQSIWMKFVKLGFMMLYGRPSACCCPFKASA
jgi:GMP synthase (glutamine-hydrolysing)